ncbi:MAG: radical SAM protein [Clostridia bacterium]|nr:radical SAM protein [Clostridia bacterium]
MNWSECSLCPRRCRAERTEAAGRGWCRLPSRLLIARLAPHLWEEPPISGKGGTGAVFFAGCTLRCPFCQNADISHTAAGRPFTPRELSDGLKRLADSGVESISFITGTPYVPLILDTLSLWRPPLPIVWNTSGYETVETLRLLEGAVDVYLPDLKHLSPRMSALCAGAADYFDFAAPALLEMARQQPVNENLPSGVLKRGLIIRHLILPGLTSESVALLDWLKEHLPDRPVSLMRQYTPLHVEAIPGLNRRLTPREYRRVREHMLSLGLTGYEQEAGSADEAFIPLFNDDASFV